MRLERLLTAVDAHTGGMPMRVVTSGFPHLPGDTLLKKQAYVRAHHDELRGLIVLEPRGHPGMFAAVLTEPVTDGADAGAVFLNPGGYDTMCGHGTMAIATVLAETGRVAMNEPVTEITLDTPAGTVTTSVDVEAGRAQSVTIRNVPSFLYDSEVEVEVPGLGRIEIDVAYGGDLFYAVLPAQAVGLQIEPEQNDAFISVGRRIWDAVSETVEAQHPEIPEMQGFAGVIFSGPPTDPEATLKNATFGPPGFVDRSPCGTGTCARMAVLHAKGELKLGQEFVHESIIGTLFRGKPVEATAVGGYKAIVPLVTGSAYITGFHHLVLDPHDPFPSGFYVGRGTALWGATC